MQTWPCLVSEGEGHGLPESFGGVEWKVKDSTTLVIEEGNEDTGPCSGVKKRDTSSEGSISSTVALPNGVKQAIICIRSHWVK